MSKKQRRYSGASLDIMGMKTKFLVSRIITITVAAMYSILT